MEEPAQSTEPSTLEPPEAGAGPDDAEEVKRILGELSLLMTYRFISAACHPTLWGLP